jgi:hypothetical protein
MVQPGILNSHLLIMPHSYKSISGIKHKIMIILSDKVNLISRI